ncbi:Fe(3+) dicitrate ABC transporter substrate-binding protein [Moritella yayanosii]|uniref:Iron-dicitrate transporter subunit periplasmic-binding component of ABC superfamily n=1 Tax=Moritella yayanosii TaxID=69539 RepID=A0A330LMP5_9GAMM|nr:Fe(3+) dicitrate ABC transporter substrate-binding protein [Moritella yayanosii]SQD78297.1 iron-dicitrate transporter subunit; periplasmic-binding component of ABC superfamily [Moritella yayanosii]
MSTTPTFIFKLFIIIQLLLGMHSVQAATVEHDAGTLTLTKTPTRIVVLAFSFADALAVAGVSPIGIADDGDKNRVIKNVRDRIADWQSVGSRYQPSIEAIAALKPDLIIADTGRHQSIYADLTRIAPTLLLKNRGINYQENLDVMKKIAKAVDKSERVVNRLAEHKAIMQHLKQQMKTAATFQFAVVTDKGMWLHSPASYAGSVIAELGLSSPLSADIDNAYLQTSFEQLLKTNPDWLFVGKYTQNTVLDKWQKSPLWKLLSVAKSKQLIEVSPSLWSLASGMLAAEQMAIELASYAKR